MASRAATSSGARTTSQAALENSAASLTSEHENRDKSLVELSSPTASNAKYGQTGAAATGRSRQVSTAVGPMTPQNFQILAEERDIPGVSLTPRICISLRWEWGPARGCTDLLSVGACAVISQTHVLDVNRGISPMNIVLGLFVCLAASEEESEGLQRRISAELPELLPRGVPSADAPLLEWSECVQMMMRQLYMKLVQPRSSSPAENGPPTGARGPRGPVQARPGSALPSWRPGPGTKPCPWWWFWNPEWRPLAQRWMQQWTRGQEPRQSRRRRRRRDRAPTTEASDAKSGGLSSTESDEATTSTSSDSDSGRRDWDATVPIAPYTIVAAPTQRSGTHSETDAASEAGGHLRLRLRVVRAYPKRASPSNGSNVVPVFDPWLGPPVRPPPAPLSAPSRRISTRVRRRRPPREEDESADEDEWDLEQSLGSRSVRPVPAASPQHSRWTREELERTGIPLGPYDPQVSADRAPAS